MTPEESYDSRIERLMVEAAADRRDVVALAHRVGSLEMLVNALTPLTTQVATLAIGMHALEGDVGRVEAKFDTRWEKLEASQEAARRDSRGLRNLLIVAVAAALLSPFGGIVVALVINKP